MEETVGRLLLRMKPKLLKSKDVFKSKVGPSSPLKLGSVFGSPAASMSLASLCAQLAPWASDGSAEETLRAPEKKKQREI